MAAKKAKVKKKTEVEDLLLTQLKECEIIPPEREYKFHLTRRFRFDMAWPQFYFAVEVDGGVFTRGRHTNPMGYTADCEKFALAAIDGWVVMRVTSGQVRDGKAIAWINEYFDKRIYYT